MYFPGQKNKQIFNILEPLFPNEIEIYIEPFGGTFSIKNYLSNRIKYSIYNDIKNYNLEINADEIYYKDYKEIIKIFDNENVFFFIDPPYYGKEMYYDMKNYNLKFQKELYEIINNIKGSFILTNSNHIHMKKLYSEYKQIEYKNEIIITKY